MDFTFTKYYITDARRSTCSSLFHLVAHQHVKKWKHSNIKGIQNHKGQGNPYEMLKEAHIVQKPLIASTSSYQFGGERMIKAQQGLLEWQSLEDSCLSADGEEIVNSCKYFLLIMNNVLIFL